MVQQTLKQSKMKASNARRLADTVNRENANSQYNKVHRSIDEAAKAGKYECFFYEHIKKEVGSILISEGFTFTTNSYRNETTVVIKW